jgi:tungstate transport system permease protein
VLTVMLSDSRTNPSPSASASSPLLVSSAIAEVGAIIIVGGNIRGYTRTMTTAIALETSKGELALALGLGLVLLSLSITVSTVAFVLVGRIGEK